MHNYIRILYIPSYSYTFISHLVQNLYHRATVEGFHKTRLSMYV